VRKELFAFSRQEIEPETGLAFWAGHSCSPRQASAFREPKRKKTTMKEMITERYLNTKEKLAVLFDRVKAIERARSRASEDSIRDSKQDNQSLL